MLPVRRQGDNGFLLCVTDTQHGLCPRFDCRFLFPPRRHCLGKSTLYPFPVRRWE